MRNAAAANNNLPAIGGGGAASAGGGSDLSSLPNFYKPASTGLKLFDEIEINENDQAEVQEEKSQRQQLKQEKESMIAERNQKRAEEFEAA